MERFLNTNPGMKSRFTHYIHLEDYTPDELYVMFESMLTKQNYVLTEAAAKKATAAIITLYQNRSNDFANGRTIRNLCDEVIRRLASRVAELPKENRTKEALITVTADDIPFEKQEILSVEEILADLDAMIGLAEVKQAVRQLAQAIMIEKEKEEQGLTGQNQAIHIVFTGNPGTGKTTVARKLGALFQSMGLLPSSKVIEVDRSRLVASYVGQTAPQVNQVCNEAIGGILFIDEAYTLSGEGPAKDSFGQEAIDTLLKRMDDDRGKFVVIAAGYQRNMETFIRSNPGLKSRFTHFLHLVDYTPEELYAIYVSMAKQNGYTPVGDALTLVQKVIGEIYQNRSDDFANGRTIRNLFDETKRRLASRIAALPKEERTREVLTLITAADIPISKGGAA
jgi:SpoVK/Ycf46/Vps4 family AAA+-type ATPase